MRTIALLGSTGSIGRSTLRVVEAHAGAFRVVALAAGRNVERLAVQVERHRPSLVAVADREAAARLRARVSAPVKVVEGAEGLIEAATHPEADTVVCALVGALGVRPTWAAVAAGRRVALANKEALVVAGAQLVQLAAESGAVLLPVDSEHNALHQCLRGEPKEAVRRLWLTASGGPFRDCPLEALAGVTPEEALRHPTWSMGPKITVDSATLMNKGLEVIEAHWLFGLRAECIRVVVHPQSVVHSMVEFVDGAFKAHLGATDMAHPIQYALTWPERWPAALESFDPVAVGRLEFCEPDPERFPCLALGYEALARGGAAPAVLNAANEVAVAAFLEGRIRFTEIPRLIRQALDVLGDAPGGEVDALLEADARARRCVGEWIASRVGR